MKSCIRVMIDDDNLFFAQGVKLLLADFFSVNGCAVCFIDSYYGGEVDLLIQNQLTRKSYACSRKTPFSYNYKVIITVRDPRTWPFYSWQHCRNQVGVIKSRDTPADVIEVIERALMKLKNETPGFPTVESGHSNLALTPRESEVLRCIASGLIPNTVAKALSLSPKTVSAHKRAAMRKLGFQRNHELYCWLKQGGLGKELS